MTTRAFPNYRTARQVASLILISLLMPFLAGCIGGLGAGPASLAPGGGIDFSLSASPGSQSVVAGRGAAFSVAVNPPALIGTVNFSVSGLPPGVQAAFAPGFDVANGNRTLNVFTTTTTPASSSQLTITANDSSGTRTATVNLTITPAADFTLSITPFSQQVKPGASASYSVSVTLGAGAGPVNLSVVGLPNGATASFDHDPVTASGTAVLTVTAGPQIMTVVAPMDVIGSDSSGSISASFGFSIIPADFFLSQAVGPVEVNAGGTVSGQILVEPLFATPGAVGLAASDLPPGTTASFNPSTVNGAGSSLISLATDVSTAPADYTLTINGVDASGQNFTTLPLTVVPGNPAAGFFLAASPLMEEITAGESASFAVNVSAPGGALPPVSLTVTTSEDGIDAVIFPVNKGPGAFELDLSTAPSLGDTSAAITITGTGPAGTQTIQVNLLIDLPPPG